MKRLIPCLFFLAAGLAAAMTPAEFTSLYEKNIKSKEDCYRLYEAFSKGDGTEKDDTKARKWLLAAHRSGMISARKELMNQPWRKELGLTPTIPIAEVDDKTAGDLGKQLVKLMNNYVEAQEKKRGPFRFNKKSKEEFKKAIYQMTEQELARKVRDFIRQGADLNQCQWTQHTPLSLACKLGNTELVKLLLVHGADPSACNNAAIVHCLHSDDALQESKYEKYDKIEKPVISGDSANFGGGSTNWRSQARKMRKDDHKKVLKSHETRRKAKAKLLHFLIEHGADVRMYDTNGWNLMYRAAACNSSLGISMLAEAGLSPSAPQDPRECRWKTNDWKKPNPEFTHGKVAEKALPLHAAIERNNLMAVQALLKAGANPHTPTHEGVTPLELAEQALVTAESKQKPESDLHVCKDIITSIRRAGGKTSAGPAKN